MLFVEAPHVFLGPAEQSFACHSFISLVVHGHGAPLADVSGAPEMLKVKNSGEGMVNDGLLRLSAVQEANWLQVIFFLFMPVL